MTGSQGHCRAERGPKVGQTMTSRQPLSLGLHLPESETVTDANRIRGREQYNSKFQGIERRHHTSTTKRH